MSTNTECIFEDTCEAHNILYKPNDCFNYLNDLPEKYEQLTLDLL